MAVHIPEHNLTFIHIPKTGGTSITRWIRDNHEHDYYRKHCTLQTAKNHWNNLSQTFCVIRDPYDWLVSWYEYEKVFIKNRIEDIKLGKIKSFKINDGKNNLDILQDKLYSLNKGFDYYAINVDKTPQLDWAKNVDIVLRYEHLSTDFKQIQRITGCYSPLPVLNASQRKHYRHYYNKKLKNIVKEKYLKDFKFYKSKNLL